MKKKHVKDIKMAKLETPAIEEWHFMTVWIFKKIKKICVEKVVREQEEVLALQQHFLKISSNFFQKFKLASKLIF